MSERISISKSKVHLPRVKAYGVSHCSETGDLALFFGAPDGVATDVNIRGQTVVRMRISVPDALFYLAAAADHLRMVLCQSTSSDGNPISEESSPLGSAKVWPPSRSVSASSAEE